MTLTQAEIQDIIERVRRRLGEAGAHPGTGLRAAQELGAAAQAELGDGILPTIADAVEAASDAFQAYQRIGLQGRKAIVASIRASMLEHAERLAEMAVAETGVGRGADKIVE
jgi:acyl-CoA reductase-like NAD-dependent aldehyde dehydrogenase